MDLLRSLGSAAASSLLQKSGLNLPFSLGDKVTYFEDKTIWTLYDATKRDDSSSVSVFFFDGSLPNKRNLLPIAKNALRKLRTIRHPDVLKFIDAVETETTIYIVTERIQPLGKALTAWSSKPANAREEWLIWGLQRISVALGFVNDSCKATHGNIRVESVFISPSGEWKLGGFDVLSTPGDEAAVLYTLGAMIPDAKLYSSPEVKKGGWSALKSLDVAAADSYSFGILIHSVFNPNLPLPPTTDPPHAAPLPSSRGAIPLLVFPPYKRLLNPNSKSRLTAKGFLDLGMAERAGEGAGFFSNNNLIKICSGLNDFALASEAEKNGFLRMLKDSAASFPPEFAAYKVLPSLLSSLEHGGASAASLLPLVLQLGKNLAPTDYTALIIAPLIKLYASPDRGTRMALLENLPEYIEKLDNKAVSDKIWPNLQTGFSDTVAIIREATVRSILLISPKLSDRILNNDLLRHLAKSQMDPEASIRTNTCVLIGRIAPSLSQITRRKVLVPAFSRSLKDDFVHARVAGLMALMATMDCFEIEEMATKVIPCAAPCLLDKEKTVRDQAFKAVDQYLKRIESHASTMPETMLNADGESPSSNGIIPTQGDLVNSAAGAAGALAGWAMSSLTKKLAPGDLQSTMNNGAVERPTSAPPLDRQTNVMSGSLLTKPTALPMASPAASSYSTPGPSTKAKAMQLGAHKLPDVVIQSVLDDELVEGGAVFPGAWGDDLIDVNADTDDWSAFASGNTVENNAPRNEDPDEEGWGDMSDRPTVQLNSSVNLSSYPSSPTPPVPKPNPPALTPNPPRVKRKPPTKPKSGPSQISVSAPATTQPTPIASPVPPVVDGWDSIDAAWQEESPASTSQTPTTPALSSMSKEEKAAEMARRREERKQRIAQLKEQKKATG